jgi:hypothetical protein
MPLRRAGTVRGASVRNDPGSAKQRYALHRARETSHNPVMRGRDPRIHHFRDDRSFEADGLPGRSPATTRCLYNRRRSINSQSKETPRPRPAIHPGEILAPDFKRIS